MADPGDFNSIRTFPGNGVQTVFEVSFAGGYISRADVFARLIRDSDATFVDVEVEWLSDNTIRYLPAVPTGYTLRVYRLTPVDKSLVDYSAGALLSEQNLDLANRQAILSAAESRDAFGNAVDNDALRDATVALQSARSRSSHTGTQVSDTVTYTPTGVGAVNLPLTEVVSELTLTPEMFGAVGNNVDDSDAIQRSINAAKASGRYRKLPLTKPFYRTSKTILMDTTFLSGLEGSSFYGFAVPSTDALLRVDSTNVSPLGNYFGHRPELNDLRLMRGSAVVGGPAQPREGIGLDMNASTVTGSAQCSSNRISIAGHDRGIQFSNHAYNSIFINSEIWSNRIGVYWPAGGLDNGERNTFLAPTVHDNTYAWVNNEPGGSIQVFGGSSDFNKSQGKVNGGKLFFTSHHFESGQMGQADGYGFYAEGDGGLISVTGGWVLNQAEPMPIPTLCYIGDGAKIEFDKVFMHNLKLTRETVNSPTAIFAGAGIGSLTNTSSFGATEFPDRLHQGRTSLIDQAGTDVAFKDMSWIDPRTTGAATGRLTSPNLNIVKSTSNPQAGARGVAITKSNAVGQAGSVGLMWVPCKQGQLAFGGFYYAKNAAAPPTGTINANWFWATIDRIDANGLPIFFNQTVINGAPNLAPSTIYQMCAFGGGFSGRVAPAGTTHFVCRLDLDNMSAGTLNIGARWMDAA